MAKNEKQEDKQATQKNPMLAQLKFVYEGKEVDEPVRGSIAVGPRGNGAFVDWRDVLAKLKEQYPHCVFTYFAKL